MQNIINVFKSRKAFWIELIVTLIGLASFVYWGSRKQPWFCDEIYTYESANGFEQDWPDSHTGTWMTGADVEAFFAADSDRLSLNDITVRLYNDHVPLYFWLFRIVSFYLFKGSGSIWIGLGINLVFYLLLLNLGYRMFLRLTQRPLLSGTVMLLTFVVNRLVLEQITILRMYAMLLLLQLLLLLAVLWLLRDAGGSGMKPAAFLFLFTVSVAGLLTHYDFWIFYAVTATLSCIWLLILSFRQGKKFWTAREFRYILAWLGNFCCSLFVTILLFPYCRWNLNRGKGQLALQSLFVFSSEKVKNILWGYERLAGSIFGDQFPAAAALLIVFGCIAGGICILLKKKESKKLTCLILIVLIAQVYQFAVCFTLPDAREERYLWGSFTVMMLCMAGGGALILQELFLKIRNDQVRKKAWCLVSSALAIGILAGELAVIDGGNGIPYLFNQEKDVTLLKEYSETPWVVYGPTMGVYSYYDFLIPAQICFLSLENTDGDAAAFELLRDQDSFILYTFEDNLSLALAFFKETLGQEFTSRYLTKSVNLSVYLITKEEAEKIAAGTETGGSALEDETHERTY